MRKKAKSIKTRKDNMKKSRWIGIKIAEEILKEVMDWSPSLTSSITEPYHIVFDWAHKIEEILDSEFKQGEENGNEIRGLATNGDDQHRGHKRRRKRRKRNSVQRDTKPAKVRGRRRRNPDGRDTDQA